jgi:hypothetical protein
MSQLVIASDSAQQTRITAKYDFVVNEFPRIHVPAKKNDELQDFREMNKIQRQLIIKRLIERVEEI